MQEIKIFIEVPSWLGDAVMATPAIKNIQKKFPNSKLIILGSALSVEIFRDYENVENIIINDSKQASWRYIALYKLAKKVGKVDLAFSFRRSFSSRILSFFIKAKRKYLYKRLSKESKHQVLRYNDFVNKSLHENLEAGELCINTKPHFYPMPTLGINPGATYGSAKRWYPEEFAKVAMGLSKKYYIVLFGSENEKEICDEIENILKQNKILSVRNLAGKTNIRELCSLIGGLKLFITNDSGPMHIAAAYKIKTVAIFGSTNYAETDGWKNEKQIIITEELDCSPCMKRTCPLSHHNCMKNIKAEDVLKKIIK